MITNERIDELLRQKAKIWGIGKSGNVFCVGLKFRPQTLNNKKWLENKYEVYGKFFETEEEAKWFAEFGCIERTERLELPTWEEVEKLKDVAFHTFITKDGFEAELVVEVFENKISIIGIGGAYDIWDLTKENYTLACRKAKELFLGENNEI